MDPRYPAGEFRVEKNITPEMRAAWIEDVRVLPEIMRAAVAGLSDERLDTPYRAEGWTLRQVVHHVPDSHMTSYLRFKLALTEDRPKIAGYNQEAWANLADSRGPIEMSLALLDALHVRWVKLLEQLSDEDYARTILHSESGIVRLDVNLSYYAWHGKNHAGHITSLRQRMGW